MKSGYTDKSRACGSQQRLSSRLDIHATPTAAELPILQEMAKNDTHLRCNTPRTTSRPTSGNIAVNVSISASLGTLTVPSPLAFGRAAPRSSDTHWRTTPPVPDATDAARVGSGRASPGGVAWPGRGACGARAVVTASGRDRISLMRVARVRGSGKTLCSRLPALSSPSSGLIQRWANVTSLRSDT